MISGAAATDTAAALLSAPLVVEVRYEKGRLVRGTEVVFTGAFTAAPDLRPLVRVASVSGGNFFGGTVAATTDATGRAAVRVALGVVAGPVQVSISVPAERYEQTAGYTVTPGAGIQIVAAPRDTAVAVGASYTLRVALADGWGNPTGTVPTVSVVAPGTAATVAGTTVRGVSVGRVRLAVQSGERTMEAFASVVPSGTLMAMRADGVYQFATDGSGMRRAAVSSQGAIRAGWRTGSASCLRTERAGG